MQGRQELNPLSVLAYESIGSALVRGLRVLGRRHQCLFHFVAVLTGRFRVLGDRIVYRGRSLKPRPPSLRAVGAGRRTGPGCVCGTAKPNEFVG